MLIPTRRRVCADSATALSPMLNEVVARKHVPAGAMGLLHLSSGGCATSQDVLPQRHLEEMVGLHAAAVRAGVFDGEAFGQGPVNESVHESVRTEEFAVVSEAPITAAIATAKPLPTPLRHGDLVEESLDRNAPLLQQHRWVAMHPPSVVVRDAPRSIVCRLRAVGNRTLGGHRELNLSGAMRADVDSIAPSHRTSGGAR